jgi:glycosyltransferase involved in cell wall biosynthesis
VGGLSEYIKNGENGVLVSPNDPVELSNAIKFVCEKEMNKMMMERAVELKASFSWSEFTYELNSFIESLY